MWVWTFLAAVRPSKNDKGSISWVPTKTSWVGSLEGVNFFLFFFLFPSVKFKLSSPNFLSLLFSFWSFSVQKCFLNKLRLAQRKWFSQGAASMGFFYNFICRSGCCVVVVFGGEGGLVHQIQALNMRLLWLTWGCCLWAGGSPVHAGWRAGTSPQKDLLRQAEARGGGVLRPGGEHQESTARRRCHCPPGNQVQPPSSQTTAIRRRGRCILFSCVCVQYRSCIFSFLWFKLLSVVTVFHWRYLDACVIYIWILYSIPSSVFMLEVSAL